MRDRPTAPVEAIERAVRILDAFSVDQPELGVAEISRRLGIKRSTTHRALATLAAGGLLRQVSATQKYTLGSKLLSLAYVLESQLSLVAVALPAMRSLRDRCNETVALHLLDGLHRVVVQQVESTHDLRRTYPDIGKPLPLYAGSPGKLLLAYLSPTQVEEVLREAPAAEVDRASLWEELSRIRGEGYAISVNQRTPGIASASCPVRDRDGRVIAAINLSGPTLRLTEEKALEYLPWLREAGLLVSSGLGYSGAAGE